MCNQIKIRKMHGAETLSIRIFRAIQRSDKSNLVSWHDVKNHFLFLQIFRSAAALSNIYKAFYTL